MQHFLDTVETIPEGYGFEYYDGFHLTWLALGAVFIVLASVYYRRLSADRREKMRKTLAAALVADEVWKMFWLAVGGNYLLKYLPLHLCSINIFVIAYHALRPNKTLDNFLYVVCIPGALSALLFPTWFTLPLWNFMHLHSFTIHILLMAYPIVLLAGGDIRPELKQLPKTLLLLCAFGVIALIVNILFNENFMFLMYPEPGNPLQIFEDLFGSHLVGLPIIIAAIILVMYTPVVISEKYKNRKELIS